MKFVETKIERESMHWTLFILFKVNWTTAKRSVRKLRSSSRCSCIICWERSNGQVWSPESTILSSLWSKRCWNAWNTNATCLIRGSSWRANVEIVKSTERQRRFCAERITNDVGKRFRKHRRIWKREPCQYTEVRIWRTIYIVEFVSNLTNIYNYHNVNDIFNYFINIHRKCIRDLRAFSLTNITEI